MQNAAVLYCHFIGLIPGLFVWTALFAQESLPLALIYFEGICLLLLPSLLLAKRQWLVSSQRNFSWYYLRVADLLSNWRAQVKIAVVLSILTIVVLVAGWFLIARNNLGMFGVRIPPDAIEKMVKTMPLPQTIFGSIWFSIVNPILEELFWRVFLADELDEPCSCMGDSKARDAIPPPPDRPSIELSFVVGPDQRQDQDCSHSQHAGRSFAAIEASRWLISSYYAAYHVIVVIRFFPAFMGLTTLIFLTIVGRILLHVRDMPRFGMCTSIIVHAGLDAAFAIVAADFVSNDMHLKQS